VPAPAGAPAVVEGETGSAKRQRQETPELLLMRQKNEVWIRVWDGVWDVPVSWDQA
jgi:hypothetical protein